MTPEMLKALEDCIEKRWNLVAAGCCIVDLPKCPLCETAGEMCQGCPINIATSGNSCLGTPFWKWANAYYRSPEYWDATEQEIEFLLSLLPEDHRLRKG